jgi:UPF0755 protein
MRGAIPEMAQNRSSSKIGCGVLGLVILLGLTVIVLIVVPQAVNAKAKSTFGNASPQLSFRQHLYLSTVILLQTSDLSVPVNPTGPEVDLTIDSGETVASIAEKLYNSGLISNPKAFSSYLQYAGMDTTLKAGDYNLSPAMSPLEIAQAIQSSISADVTLSILPGWRVEEIANSLPTTGLTITSQEFLDAVHTHPEGYSFSSCLTDDLLEGYLFPGSYTFPRDTTVNDLLPQLLMNFETQVTPELRNGFTAHGLDLCQAITLASIVQREAMVEEEMPMIASVFYNRLNSGATLASDPTVQYALGYNEGQATWWTNPLSQKDLQVDSPYNTYVYASLPPGPISNPGLAAIEAVASPADTPYFYFRAACDGSGRHLFAQTYDEHLANACP